jgi:integrase
MTPRDASEALDELLAQAPRAARPARVRKPVTLREAADEWLRYEEHEARVKRSTVMDYRDSANRLCRMLGGDRLLEEITTEVIERWKSDFVAQRRLRDGKLRETPPAARTIRKYLVNLHGIFRRAGEVYGITPNPVAAVKRPGRVRQPRQLKSSDYLEPRAVHALIAAAEDDTDAAIFATAAFCGLRLGELLALRWRAVDFERSLIRVEASFTRNNEDTPKSGDGRAVPMAPEVANALKRLRNRPYLLEPPDLVFLGRGGAHVDSNALRRRFYDALERAGVPREGVGCFPGGVTAAEATSYA